MKRMTLAIVVLLLAGNCVFASGKAALTPGEAAFKRIVDKLVNSKQMAVKIAADIKRTGPKGKEDPISVKLDLAFDSRDKDNQKKRISVDSFIAGKPVKLRLNTEAEDVYFNAIFPDQPPMAYHLDMSAKEPGKAPTGMMGHDGQPSSIIDLKNFPGMDKMPKGFDSPRPGASPPHSMDSRFIKERLKGFGGPGGGPGAGGPMGMGGGGADPMADIISQIKAHSGKNDKDTAQSALEGVTKRSNLIFIKPNIIKIVPKDANKGTAKLYFDPKSNLPQTMSVNDPEKSMQAYLRFSGWSLNKPVNTKLFLPRGQYAEFTADAFGKIFGAFAAFAGPSSGPMLPPGQGPMGGGGKPQWMNITPPAGFKPMSGGSVQGKPKKPMNMEDAQRSLADGMKGFSSMMKKFSDPKFQKSMQGLSNLGRSMGAPTTPKPPAYPGMKNQKVDYDKLQRDAEKSMLEAQKNMQMMMQKLNSPQFKKMMQEAEDAAKKLEKSMQNFQPSDVKIKGNK